MSDEMYRTLLDVEQAQGSNFKQKVVTVAQRRDVTPADLRIDIGINVQEQPDQGLHIVFCLDESGSMGGSPWSELISSLNKIWMMRAEEQVCTSTMHVCHGPSAKHQNAPYAGPNGVRVDRPVWRFCAHHSYTPPAAGPTASSFIRRWRYVIPSTSQDGATAD